MARSMISASSLAVLFAALPTCCPAQESESDAAGKVYVAFRMENWQAKHMHDAAAAKQHADLLKKLNCEVKTSSHDGHTDVQCRTVFWKSMVVKSHQEAHQWIDWLHSAGFETIHGYRVGTHQTQSSPGREAVQYRLADWKTRHIHDAKEQNQLIALYRGLGVEVKVNQHDGHTDVSARCPEWMEIRLPSHPVADAWQAFLNDAGFETKHVH